MRKKWLNESIYWILVILGFSIFTFSYFKKINTLKTFTSVEVINPIIDVGSISQDSIVFVNFQLKGIGKEKLKVLSIEPDCHCTLAKIDSTAQNVKNEIDIKAAFDNKITGIFQKTIKVFLNTRDSPKILTLRGRVLSGKKNYVK